MNIRTLTLAVAVLAMLVTGAKAQDKKPNILVIWGDDIGQSNISANTMGMMGYRTPNIDRTAIEGMIFTDDYGEQSCTAGRSSFIMAQSVYRTGRHFFEHQRVDLRGFCVRANTSMLEKRQDV